MSNDVLSVSICPETGIGSVMLPDGSKADLMPGEVDALREANGDLATIQAIIADVDADFAASLTTDDLVAISRQVR